MRRTTKYDILQRLTSLPLWGGYKYLGFMNNTLVVVGAQWGDEGKGKITDFYARKADVVVRHQGGNNAGHTIVFDNRKFALQSIPSGIFNPHIKNVMANGMVINPVSLIEELERLHAAGITDYKLYISDRAACVMPYHRMLDGAYEQLKGGRSIGTTKKGIGPAYTDKYSRVGIRMGDLLDPEYFAERLHDALLQKNLELTSLGMEPCDFDTIYNEYLALGERLRPMICDTSVMLNEEYERGSKILFEGAQGVMLCIDHGTYPFVTSSSPTAASVPLNTGLAPRYVDRTIGVCKSLYDACGRGPVPDRAARRYGDVYPRARPRVRHRYGPSAPCGLVRCRRAEPCAQGQRHRLYRAYAVRRADRTGQGAYLHRL